jgi:hypothetical protein
MTNSEFEVFFDVLELLNDQSLDQILKKSAAPIVERQLDAMSPVDAPRKLRAHYTKAFSAKSAAPVKCLPVLSRLPIPTNAASICRVLPVVTTLKPLALNLDVIMAKGMADPFVIRFDGPHSRPEHSYFHCQLSESLTIERMKPVKFHQGFSGSVPAIPVPAKSALHLVSAVLVALYGSRPESKIDLTGLQKDSKRQVMSALREVSSNCHI